MIHYWRNSGCVYIQTEDKCQLIYNKITRHPFCFSMLEASTLVGVG